MLLAAHPLVRDVAVIDWHNPRHEGRPTAYVAPAAEAKTLLDSDQHVLLLEQLRTFLAERLPKEQIPRIIALERLPRREDGRIAEEDLPAPTQPRPIALGECVAPRDAIEEQLAAIWSELLGVVPVGVNDRFSDLGGRSVLALSLMTRIEEQFGRKLPIVALYHEPTIAHLAEWLRRPSGSGEQTPLVPIRARGSRRPLFCVHPAGGTVFCYVPLASYLGEDQPVYGVQAQGTDGQQAPHATVAEMAVSYAKAIRAEQPQGPYRVCGWSTGGIIAFEVAQRLREQGADVELLALFDAGMPAARGKAFDQEDVLQMLLMLFPGQSREELAALQQASPDEQLAYFQRCAELAQLLLAGAAGGHARHVYDVFQANVQAISEYQPQPWPGKITLFRAATASTPMHKDPLLGWGPWACAVSVQEVPGSHVDMFREPALATLAAALKRCLDELEERGSG